MNRIYLTTAAIICTTFASMALATDTVTSSISLNQQIHVQPSAFAAKNLAVEPCGTTKGAGSSLAVPSCGLADNPSSTLFNKADSTLKCIIH